MAKKRHWSLKVLKWFSLSFLTLIILVIGAMIVIPVFYKDEIRALVKQELEKTIHADVGLGEVKLNLFKTWPNIGVVISDMSIRTYDTLDPDTLFYVSKLTVGANAKAYLDDKAVVVNEVRIDNPKIIMEIDSSGVFNWDIFEVSQPDTASVDTVQSKPIDSILQSLQLAVFEINDAHVYLANEMNHSFFDAKGLNFSFSGDLSKSSTKMETELLIDKLKFIKNRKIWLDETPLKVELSASANRDSSLVRLNKTNLMVGEIALDWFGYVKRTQDSTLFVETQFSTNELKIARLLALIPLKDKEQFKSLSSGGKTQFIASVSGPLDVEKKIFPQMDTKVRIQDGYLTSKKNVHKRIEEINLDLKLYNAGNGQRASNIDLNNLSFKLQGQPFKLKMNVHQKRRYAEVKASVQTDIELQDLAMLTARTDSIAGHLHADVFINTNTKDLKEKKYENVQAKGDVILSNFILKPKNKEKSVRIDLLDIYVDQTEGRLDALDLSLGNSDLHISGVIDNYLEYLLYGNYLSADLKVHSDEVDFAELASIAKSFPSATDEDTADVSPTVDTIPTSPFLPDSIALTFESSFDKLNFGEREVQNLKGNFKLEDKVFTIEDLSANLFNGSFDIRGEYNNVRKDLIEADLEVGIDHVDLQKVFGLVNELMPEYQLDSLKLYGDLGADLKVKTSLDSNFAVIPRSLRFDGAVYSSKLNIQTKTKGITATGFRAGVGLGQGELRVNEMNINLLGGNFFAKGGIKKLEDSLLAIDLIFDINHLDLGEAYDSLKYNLENIPDNYNVAGDIDAHFSVSSNLTRDFKLVKPSLEAKGEITSVFVNLGESEGLSELMDSLGVERMDSVKVRDIKMGFIVKDERFVITASTLTLGRFVAATKGRVRFDGEVENVVVVDVDKKNKEGSTKQKGTSLKGGLILYGSLEDLVYNIDVRLNKNSVMEELDRLEEKAFKKREKAKTKEKKKKKKR